MANGAPADGIEGSDASKPSPGNGNGEATPRPDRLLLHVEYRVGNEDTGDRDYITVTETTTAGQLCTSLATKHQIAEEERAHLVLIMIYPTREEDGSLTRIMHSLKPHERPMHAYFGEKADKIPPADLMWQELARVFERPQRALGAFSREQLLDNDLIHWCLKDIHSPPLDLPGYVSGSEASEEEDGAPCHDMAQVGQGYYSGYLLKRSNRDACLWRRRWCILGEDKIWYMKRKDQGRQSWQGKAAFISLVSNVVMEHDGPSAPFGLEVQTAHRVFVFRAPDRPQQLLWIDAIRTRIEVCTENDLVRMAELMICDEELARAKRVQQAVEGYWHKHSLSASTLQSSPPSSSLQLPPPSSSLQPVSSSASVIQRGAAIGDGLALCMAVQDFKELCRHDRRLQSHKKWSVARRIFGEFLRGKTLAPSDDNQPDTPTGRRRSLFTQEAVQQVESQLARHEAEVAELRAAKSQREAEPPPPTLFDKILGEL